MCHSQQLISWHQKTSPGTDFPQDKLGSLLSSPISQSFPASSAEDESGTRGCAAPSALNPLLSLTFPPLAWVRLPGPGLALF